MKRIAIFCDGTWNKLTGSRTTHVAALARAVTPTAADGVTQLVFYQEGVGTGRGSNRIARQADKLLGGVFGWGLDDNVLEAYRNLAFWYEKGDEIFIFGFSRGAYTARSLAGLIRTAGIPPRTHLDQVAKAMELYRARGDDTRPDSQITREFRRAFAPETATSEDDLNWRRSLGDEASYQLKITYLGVWDTVGALGLPRMLGPVSRLVNEKYDFHDANLSRSVAGARHAVAIDERRALFEPSLWDNLDTLNGDEVTGDERPYQEKWFPGVHSVVGGSGGVPDLSAYSADWVIEGARDRRLEFDRDLLGRVTGDKDALASMAPSLQKAGLTNLFGKLLKDRAPPKRREDISEAARLRVAGGAYRPPTLAPYLDDL